MTEAIRYDKIHLYAAFVLEFNLQSKSSASKRSESGGCDLLVSVRVQALTEMAAKLPGGYE